MSRLACRCLNITIHISSSGWQDNSIPTLKLFSEECEATSGCDTLYEVNLDVAGVVLEVPVLASSQQIGDWIITSCQNCKMKTFVRHAIKSSKVFVFPGLLNNEKEFKKVFDHENYSPIFKILLQLIQDEDGELMRRKRVSSMSFGHEDPDMKVVHEQMKTYLKKEEDAMERKIRLFEEEQRKAFLALQAKAHHHRSLLFAAIAKSRDQVKWKGKEDSAKLEVRKKVAENPSNVTIAQKDTGKGSLMSATQNVTVTIQDSKTLQGLPKLSAAADGQEDSLFSLEGFENEAMYGEDIEAKGGIDDIAFPQSDDEDSSTNDSSFRDVSALSTTNLATSVPVTIPLFQRKTEEPDSPSFISGSVETGDAGNSRDVGNSIKMLALSVQDTGMFGDLPRPRMMTNPFS